eukprot:73613_1
MTSNADIGGLGINMATWTDIGGYDHFLFQNTIRNCIYLACAICIGWGTMWLLYNKSQEGRWAKYESKLKAGEGEPGHSVSIGFVVIVLAWCWCLYTP